MVKLTQERLKELVNYDSETGDFTWKKRCIKEFSKYSHLNSWNTRFANNVAGCIDKSSGYMSITVEGKSYKLHRLVWLFTYGYFPENEIDHISRVKTDNRLVNLREVSSTCNMRNRDKMCTNTSGVTGVSWSKRKGKWNSQISISGKGINLGSYIDFEGAVKARWEAEVKYNFPNCNTTSSAYKYLSKEK